MSTWYSHSPTSVLKLILLATVFGVCSASHSSSNQITSRAGQPQPLSGRKSPDQVVFGYIYTIPNSNANDQKHRYIRTTPTSRVESAPSNSLSDHSTHTATLEDANSAGAPPVMEANPRQDEAAFAAVQRLEALMGTGSYQCYFPGPNYYNAFVPQNYCQGKSSVSKTQLKDVDFVPSFLFANIITSLTYHFSLGRPTSLRRSMLKTLQSRIILRASWVKNPRRFM
ncbi:hypothetical protein C8J55DRAFT_30905 [Lentinula edodes]|uniref:Uncharacterized protein n=1 Tax=Lentinula lateritia TaxID=40482 RepID=A0A9W9AMQ5_9AGAR|nr:hypothetical protein C8J55DRAFT_30905 [Lentinula edodes]